MATSLKAFIPRLAGILGVNPVALYERQRVLVRSQLLTAEPGRGPGSGVRACPETVAVLLISVLATDSLSEVASDTAAISISSQRATKKKIGCNFHDCLSGLLANPALAKDVAEIIVYRSEFRARIDVIDHADFDDNGNYIAHWGQGAPYVFVHPNLGVDPYPSKLKITASISGDDVYAIAKELEDALVEQPKGGRSAS